MGIVQYGTLVCGRLTRAAGESDLNAIVVAATTHNLSAAEHAAANLVRDILSAKSASTAITNRLQGT